ncbi:hypothetical protein BAC1_01574 [uncultured bacterium]|nr:hypothetical protein BAC1_01574 [uncultured bacterium]
MEIIGFGKIRVLNVALLAVCVFLAVWLGAIWLKPVPDFDDISIEKKAVSKKEPVKVSQVSYDVIVEKDLFKESRRKFIPKPAPPPVKPAPPPEPPPPPKRPPPGLVLIGTILMDDERKAIIEHGGKRNYYAVGDIIEEFVINEIGPGQVLLDRDGEPLRIVPAN